VTWNFSNQYKFSRNSNHYIKTLEWCFW